MKGKIKKVALTGIIILSMLMPIVPSAPNVQAKSANVYVTDTGSKYHKKSCRTLKRSKNLTKMTKSEAKEAGYEACKVCKP